MFCPRIRQYNATAANISQIPDAAILLTTNKSSKTTVGLVEITAAQVDQRLDNFLIKHLARVPRTRIYRALRKGEVRVNKKRSKPDYRLQRGDQVRIPPLSPTPGAVAKPRPPASLVRELESAVLFENEHLVVVDKPAGLAVHGGSGLAWGLIDAMRLIHGDEIELVHRLDRDTSGCLMLARHRAALLELQDLLRQLCRCGVTAWPTASGACASTTPANPR